MGIFVPSIDMINSVVVVAVVVEAIVKFVPLEYGIVCNTVCTHVTLCNENVLASHLTSKIRYSQFAFSFHIQHLKRSLVLNLLVFPTLREKLSVCRPTYTNNYL